MASSTDFKKLYDLYQIDGVKKGISIVQFCKMETAKLNDLSPLDYLTHVFRQLMEGNKDYESLLPGKLALQTI